nr:uncharacterized protein LOC123755191 [Procambarus clarkii]
MMTAVIFVVLILVVSSLLAATHLQPPYESHDAVTLSGGVEAVLATLSQPRCSVMFFTDGASTLSTVTKASLSLALSSCSSRTACSIISLTAISDYLGKRITPTRSQYH